MIAYSSLTLDANATGAFLCVATLTPFETLWYQSETEEATTYTEIHLPQTLDASDTLLRARISATPILLVRNASDSGSATTFAAGASPIPSPTAVVFADGGDEPHSSPSNGDIAAIAAGAAMSVILSIAAVFLCRAWGRRRSNKTSQAEENPANKPSVPNPSDELKAEMEDPISTQELFKQSGAYRGKPELGSEVDKTHGSSPDEADGILPTSTQDQVVENPLPMNSDVNRLSLAYPAELE